jgi:uncharacterized protein (DUF427 family)
MKTMNAMKLPGPDHPITIAPHAGRVRVISNGQVVADTTKALALQEASYPAVFYIPRADAEMALLERTPHQTYCPYKGDASYYSIRVGDKLSKNAIWSYEQPFPAMADITGHLAFYPDRVDAIEVMTA